MAYEVVMPRLGWTMEEGSVVDWLKKDGEEVHAGEILFTVEGDKAINEIESFEGGILRIPPDSPRPGTKVPVGALLAYLVQPGEAAPFEQGGTGAGAATAVVTTAQAAPVESSVPAVASAPAVVSGNGSAHAANTAQALPTISPRARRVAVELGVDWLAIKGSGRTGRIVERDIRAAAEIAETAKTAAAAKVRISPVARRAAEDLNVDVEALAAAMPGKRIERADVERAVERSAAPTPAPGPGPSLPGTTALPTGPVTPSFTETRTPVPHIRKLIAERMAASAHTTAPVTLTTEADATELVMLRKQLKQELEAAGRSAPSYNDILARLAAEALIEFPALNARFEQFGEEGASIVQSTSVNIGFAVDTDRGLLVPVIRDVQSKNLRQVSRESAALVEAARAGTITGDQMRGGTFTITNLGMYDIDAFTPIINLPECAIMGVGRIVPKQVVIDADAGTLAIRHMVFLSLTFDHRLVDGAPAARFLQRFKAMLEHPLAALI